MGMGEIPIQRQRMFTFGDALCSTLGVYVRIPTKPATNSNRKPGTDSDLKPAGIPI